MTGTNAKAQAPMAVRIFEGKLYRLRKVRSDIFSDTPTPPPEPVRRPIALALSLALALKIEDAVARGTTRYQYDASRLIGMSAGRLSQISRLAFLAPDIQEQILFTESFNRRKPFSDKRLGPLSKLSWTEQREIWRRDFAPMLENKNDDS